ncbi:DoxX family protein [Kribbella italica]|uniref:Putative membrane protein YphA (DoxX/SURF4 family) n=1 Tax=Kribbella italica TaxID=1540520 RepID=A0A7W9J7K5_9ACTN|nr:DoxX family protein [Kribbella italica]MBB5837101.1 putative membrane protein YphA (DoxX/SURF4 family) [Kribbella italica]
MSSIGTTVRTWKIQPGTIGLWILRLVLTAEFAAAGIMKLAGNEQMVAMFGELGTGQWLRYAVGVLEIAGALGLLIPRLCGLAALGLAALMTGAALTNAFVLDVSPAVPLAMLAVAGLVAWFRRSTIQALFRR